MERVEISSSNGNGLQEDGGLSGLLTGESGQLSEIFQTRNQLLKF